MTDGIKTDGLKRRDFLKVLGVGGASATVAGCGPGEVERLLPYVVHPEEITPGVATWYATTCRGCSAECGMWVRTREGRAVKVEGNPSHPVSQGGLCVRGHSTLQHLYNPDRFHGPMIREGDEFRQGTWEEAEQLLAARIGISGNVMFIGAQMGPTMNDLVDRFVGAVGGTRVHHDAVSDAPLREATRIAYGVDQLPHYDIGAARLLLSFGSDFIDTGSSPVAHNRGLARMSAVEGHGEEAATKGRFVYLGARLSTTGLNADEWLPIRPGSEAIVALGMAAHLAGANASGPYANLLRSYSIGQAAEASGISEEVLTELADRFAAEGPSLAMGPGVGAHHRNATAANLAVLILNDVAGDVGRTVTVGNGPTAASSSFSEIADAIDAMAGGRVGVALVHGTNPAFSLPPSSGFREAFEQVRFKVSFASAMDETAAMADLILPDRHFLESWDDAMPRPGVMAILQPVMQPVPHFDSKQAGDVLLAVAANVEADMGAATFYEYLRGRHEAMHDASMGDFATMWTSHLRDGFVDHSAMMGAGMSTPPLRAPDQALTFDVPALDGDGDLALVVYPSPRFGGGEFANSPWMQELPDPVSKITWHSWLEMNPATAEARGLREGEIVRVTSPHGSVDVPLWPYPGIREDVVALQMGTGHTDMGRWATGTGVNAMTLLPATAEQPSGAFVTMATTVSVETTGARRRLATIEGSNDQYDRPIAPAVALADLGHAEEEEGAHHEELQELQGYGGVQPVPAEDGAATAFPLPGADHGLYAASHEQPRWGMAIDLDKCTGCSACVTACQAENNVPWVGEQQVQMGRDMNWMRIERYYEHVDATHASELDVRFLPMLCQHCGNAPCEPVCPVFATYHTPEGVNAQVYNRCVGTRYCANNCPYKVRVFNWYRYTDENVPEPMNWQWNPDVTVRGNGVMEKCSFCMQRVRDAENRAALEEGRPVRDGEIVTACQQTCPAEAIVFGNLRDPESAVSVAIDNERTYKVLDEFINTQPAVHYLKKVTFHEVSGGH
ncbi:MAG: 4Fe-4S dicluster domain-containing protein [Gemmatimonadota bacterium]|nr:4Fe-4S dicluster domain-containing protein [Gemmatimonadota bacterium]